MPNKQFHSPLRYPGGKGKLISFMKLVYESNNLMGNTYIEPYTGGGAIALSLLIDKYANNIIINDYDKSIYAFWHSILNHTDEFCRLVNDTSLNIDTWRTQKEVQLNKSTADLLELGFSTFYLNRTNRSGIIKAGVIGGVNQSGNWKMDVRYNKKDLLERIIKIANHKDQITLHNLDTCDLIDEIKVNQSLLSDSFFYLDPPYYTKGKDLYVNFYNHNDHAMLSNKLDSISDCKWLLSYDNNFEITKLYHKYKKITYNLTYSVERKYQGSEVIVYSDSITLPMKKQKLKNISRIKRDRKSA